MTRDEMIANAVANFEKNIASPARIAELDAMSDEDQKEFLKQCGTITHPETFEPYLKHKETGEIFGPFRKNVNSEKD
tara:strand:- start:45 stop:275 length:231 start_codon:yes stop_codon:yes gene_type:complete